MFEKLFDNHIALFSQVVSMVLLFVGFGMCGMDKNSALMFMSAYFFASTPFFVCAKRFLQNEIVAG